MTTVASPLSMLQPIKRHTFAVPQSSLTQKRDHIASVVTKQRQKSILVHAEKTEIHRPLVGSRAPAFEAEAVINQQFSRVKLSNYAGKSFVVLFFYPLNFTFVCPSELTALSDRYAEFKKNECEILAVSTDSVFSHLAWIQTDRKSGGLGNIDYPLVSDLTKAITKTYHVLIPDQGIGLRGLFIIDKEGIIQYATINNLAIGRNVDECLRILEAIKHVKKHPDEICPTGWRPGDEGIKPDSKNYSPI